MEFAQLTFIELLKIKAHLDWLIFLKVIPLFAIAVIVYILFLIYIDKKIK